MTSQGGDSGGGVIFSYDGITSNDSNVYTMPTTAETPFYTNLLQASDGNLYGMTESGGIYGEGTLFKVNPTSGMLSILVNFNGTDGNIPYGSLIQDTDGFLYGMTYGGGSAHFGTLFKCSTSGTLTTLVNFSGAANGAYPYGSLLVGQDGELYGMTNEGGASNYGTIFKCTTSGSLTTLVSFNGSGNGMYPDGSLIQAANGTLFGMTENGGSSDSGTIFKCTPSGVLTTLIDFTGANGAEPFGSLVQATDGNLYGMTEAGGSRHYGLLFKCDTTGTYTTLVNFNDTNGANPFGNVIQATDGNLYGMTETDTSGNGTVFKCTTLGTLTTLFTFNGITNGANSESSLIQAADGNLYGMTNQGGSSGNGTIFKCTTSGTFTNLITFGVTAIGYNPAGSLISATDGNLYGTTYGGGTSGYDGTIFKINPITGGLSTLVNFFDSNGANPYGSLIQATDGNFYGMTNAGGLKGHGTIFKCTLSGVLTTLVSFNDTNGSTPFGSLIQASDGNLYGMTYLGGASHFGTLFKCTTAGVITTLVTFNGPNGKHPFNSLIQAFDGNLYGMTKAGGSSNSGTIFKCTTAGVLTTLVNFNITNGGTPLGSLLQAADSNFYGTTEGGGASGYGTIFKCDTAGTLTTLVNFNVTNGANPGGSLIQASDGNLYGMTEEGGSSAYGTMFECTTTGTLTTLINFNGITNGSNPQYGRLLELNAAPLGINKVTRNQEISLYPDPASTILTLKFNLPERGEATIKIIDVSGRELVSRNSVIDNPFTIDISSLVPGIYFLKIITEKSSEIRKFVKD